jgi:hypothetical protein
VTAGHVTAGGVGVATTITVDGLSVDNKPFVRSSDATFGRFHLFLPEGAYTLFFDSGEVSTSRQVVVTQGLCLASCLVSFLCLALSSFLVSRLVPLSFVSSYVSSCLLAMCLDLRFALCLVPCFVFLSCVLWYVLSYILSCLLAFCLV